MSTFRPDKRWEQEFKQDTLINLSQWDLKGCSETQWVQPESQGPNMVSQHTITELGAAFKQVAFQFV